MKQILISIEMHMYTVLVFNADLNVLGFKWQRQLMFRSKLTMHTAFERDDNKEPAAITAIAVSKYDTITPQLHLTLR